MSLFGSPPTATLEEPSGEPLGIILNVPHSICLLKEIQYKIELSHCLSFVMGLTVSRVLVGTYGILL